MIDRQDGKPLRCAIYTRKSTSENLDMDFNTLDAQREAGEIFVQSQAHQGWELLPEHYDDGGFTGGNMERPALQRLLADIEADKIDCVVVYKVDRLSRSLLDFARMIQAFEKQGVSFVSTTQQFNTATPIGRLTLHLLLSFAQFEREMISERTRDKMAAARRRGKWVGGPPVLGYAIDRDLRRLEVVPEEAEQVRAFFGMYLRMRSVGAVTRQADAFGWRKKRYQTRAGKWVGGGRLDENAVHRVLRNRTYTGCVVYKGEVHAGEHDAIVGDEIFAQVQAILDTKRCGRGPRRQRNFAYILQGVLFCACGSRMTTVNGTGRSGTVYRYYRCLAQTKRPTNGCSHPRVPAAEIEPVIVEKLRELCNDAAVSDEVARRLRGGKEQSSQALTNERAVVQSYLDELNTEARELLGFARASEGKASRAVSERLSEIELQRDAERLRLAELDERLRGLNEAVGRVEAALDLLRGFSEIWEMLVPEERCDVVKLLVERVDVNVPEGELRLTLHDLAAGMPASPEDDEAGRGAA
ncbi:recombinase family protein [Haliangium ochraceum]|uniref:Resolvase domain protein n=1 Tax=Haliangium ochraceum (strain DSM 14365 / JCM 11303 / SMP-2) TaxID=502025 RepID=D0LLL4_HALO1|nr:recombinase family protein [Haliangium ochraceum]ACY13231.1 Resolvase domain protein [Haliangium ochraceum DSM 14365]